MSHLCWFLLHGINGHDHTRNGSGWPIIPCTAQRASMVCVYAGPLFAELTSLLCSLLDTSNPCNNSPVYYFSHSLQVRRLFVVCLRVAEILELILSIGGGWRCSCGISTR